jgi:hypothetical protein
MERFVLASIVWLRLESPYGLDGLAYSAFLSLRLLVFSYIRDFNGYSCFLLLYFLLTREFYIEYCDSLLIGENAIVVEFKLFILLIRLVLLNSSVVFELNLLTSEKY